MKKSLVDILACPMCKGPLVLQVEKSEEDEVEKGTLTCQRCSEVYPIEDSIPNLLPPSLRR